MSQEVLTELVKALERGEEVIEDVFVSGATANCVDIENRDVAEGRFIADPEDEGAARVAYINGEYALNPPIEKMPETAPVQAVTKGLLLTFRPKSGHEPDVEQFLKSAKTFVDAEPQTTAWFAIRLADGHYGIFDVSPDHGGRFAHLTGHVGRELAKHALTLLGSLPDPELPNVIASKLDGR